MGAILTVANGTQRHAKQGLWMSALKQLLITIKMRHSYLSLSLVLVLSAVVFLHFTSKKSLDSQCVLYSPPKQSRAVKPL